MFKLISKAVDNIFSAATNDVTNTKGYDLLEQLLAEYGYGGNYWSEANYPAYAFNGYAKNVVVNYCISQIAGAAAGIKIIIKRNGTEIASANDDLMRLLKRPNPLMSYSTFMESVIAYKLISGNSYIWANTIGNAKKTVREMYALRPDRVQVIPNSFSLPLEFIYTINGKANVFPCDPVTFESEILQLKHFHPLNDLYGLSPIQVALMNVDQHNEANEWNMNLLKNAGRPSGVYNVKSQTPLTPDQKADIERKLMDKIQGTRHAGKPIITGLDVEWKQVGLSPAEMDWIQSKNTTARDICLAFKFPPYMLGLEKGSTFNNMSEARMSFYEETVIPMTENTLDETAHYLSRMTKQNIEITIDKDKITALAPRRDSARNNAIAAVNGGLISINEGRAEIDYDKVAGEQADVPMVPAGKLPINFDVSQMMGNQNNPDEITNDANNNPAKN